MRKIIKDLFTGADGLISATKTWLHIGNATATWVMIELTRNDKMNEMFLLFYMAIVAGSPIANKIIAARQAKQEK